MALTKVTTGGIKDGTITNEDISTTTSISQDKLAATPGASSIASGLMIPADKNKLDGVADNANNYSHPSAHSVSEVTGLQGLLDGKTTETYVNTQITNVIGAAPAALDTLTELAAALGDDANYAATVTTALAGKVDDSQVLTNVPSGALFTDTTYTVGDGGLTQVNFTTADNTKLDGIEAGATADQTKSDIEALGVNANTLDAYNNTTAITGNAVDVFIYDTSNDSDGGAWRKRTQATSWYNETLNTSTRGSRKEFPSVAVIVAEADTLTIYDGDTPDLDMWMVFNQGGTWNTSANMIMPTSSSPASISLLNGILSIALSAGYGVGILDFISESNTTIFANNVTSYNGNVSQRNDGLGHSDASDARRIVNSATNDIAMTVLPNAPIDSTTGLPIPTILVGCRLGLSVIKDDGTVINRTPGTTDGVTGGVYNVAFDVNGGYWYSNSYYGEAHSVSSHAGVICYAASADATGALATAWVPTHTEVRLSMGSDDGGTTTHWATTPTAGLWQNHGGNSTEANAGNMSIVSSGDSSNAYGVHKFLSANIPQSSSSVAYLTSTYNSGYMTGDIKGAWLSDTDTTNVGTELLTTTQSEFNTLADYTNSWSSTAASTVTAGVLNFVEGNNGWGDTLISYGNFKKNTHYEIRMSAKLVFGSKMVIRARVLVNGAWVYKVSPDIVNTSFSEISFIFNTEDAVQNIGLGCWGGTSLSSLDVEWFRLREADSDRSVKGKGLQVNGTITKTAVATGADLVAYSGFSAANYLEQPYNADLNFGTGDFSISGWFYKNGTDGNSAMFWRGRDSYNAGGHMMLVLSGGEVYCYSSNTAAWNNHIQGTTAISTGVWTHLCWTRSGGSNKVYINGDLASTSTDSTSLIDNEAVCRLGARQNGNDSSDGKQALWRVSATAPTAAQIKEIYEAEKPMFQENAKCTLNGSSDAVQCMAYDDSTDLLHVGTSGGRSTFQGLVRVDETSINTTEISAQGGMIVEEN